MASNLYETRILRGIELFVIATLYVQENKTVWKYACCVGVASVGGEAAQL